MAKDSEVLDIDNDDINDDDVEFDSDYQATEATNNQSLRQRAYALRRQIEDREEEKRLQMMLDDFYGA